MIIETINDQIIKYWIIAILFANNHNKRNCIY